MFRKSIIAGLLLGLSFAASGENLVSRGYELTLADFRPPATTSGGVTFRECATCDFITSRVGPGTRYTLNGSAIKLIDLRKVIARVQNREAVTVGILRHLESNTIVTVAVSLPE